MNVDFYENLPDELTIDEISGLVDTFVRESEANSLEENARKLDALGDRQWHTYASPMAVTKERLEKWIERNWQEDVIFLETVMGVCYCFSLSKSLFLRAFNIYDGSQKWEYENILRNSSGETIDAYWSLRNDIRKSE